MSVVGFNLHFNGLAVLTNCRAGVISVAFATAIFWRTRCSRFCRLMAFFSSLVMVGCW
jgi:hypothetical protein